MSDKDNPAPVLSAEEIKKKIAEILRVDIHYSPQVETYVIHGAIENIYKLMQEYAAQPQIISDEEITAMALKEYSCHSLMAERRTSLRREGYFTGFKAAMNNK